MKWPKKHVEEMSRTVPLAKLKKRCLSGDKDACAAHNWALHQDSKSHRPRYNWRKHKML